jgi:hypothetical protein
MLSLFGGKPELEDWLKVFSVQGQCGVFSLAQVTLHFFSGHRQLFLVVLGTGTTLMQLDEVHFGYVAVERRFPIIPGQTNKPCRESFSPIGRTCSPSTESLDMVWRV